VFARNVGLVNAVLVTHARARLRLGEIARAAELPRQIVSSALRTLEKRGIVRREREGDHDLFSADQSSPYYPSAYLAGLVDLPVAASLGTGRAMVAFLYGSMAVPGRATPHSDLDLLLVGDFGDRASVREALSGLGERIGRRVDAFLLSPEEFERAREMSDPHVASALAGVRLFGEV